jgi:hypothetical protein
MSCVTNLCYQISQTRLENKLKKLIFQVGKATKPSIIGGARRDRTADLNTASVALSQLSYGPNTFYLQFLQIQLIAS